VNVFAAHDLIAIDPERFIAIRDVPAWVSGALSRSPWVVVRRQAEPLGIAVGVRGTGRSERFAGRVDVSDVLDVRRPEDLHERRPGSALDDAYGLVRTAAISLDLACGPTGAYGFELASGRLTTHPGSDLDVIVRADGAPRAALLTFARRCVAIGLKTGVIVDAEATFGARGIALAELALGSPRVIAKTPNGPELIACPM